MDFRKIQTLTFPDVLIRYSACLILFILLRPQSGRLPVWAKDSGTEKGHITVMRNDLPGIDTHTAAGGPKGPVTL